MWNPEHGCLALWLTVCSSWVVKWIRKKNNYVDVLKIKCNNEGDGKRGAKSEQRVGSPAKIRVAARPEREENTGNRSRQEVRVDAARSGRCAGPDRVFPVIPETRQMHALPATYHGNHSHLYGCIDTCMYDFPMYFFPLSLPPAPPLSLEWRKCHGAALVEARGVGRGRECSCRGSYLACVCRAVPHCPLCDPSVRAAATRKA
ncbi:hypothetical protein E2C01_049584 [Portunus trituberculatus]|uniref:Uncharacterized protein n=1 Tax=Portunus trituberculatus TaxID=210409 RepID=A0A5B7G6T2_PORTR|nr:hypothetical protein [Portunus trituberculatus]